jgi:hypothetical protein
MSFLSGIGGILGGLFGHSESPYDKAMQQYKKFGQQAANQQKPFTQAGVAAIPQYQEWLQGQKNPTEFINNLMGNYQESPFANYLQSQSLRAGQNAASASGLTGSTPLYQQLEQNAGNIASQDMNKWLENVLGINTQYGQGQNNLIQGGQGSANALTQLYNQLGQQMGQGAFGSEAGRNQDFSNLLGGGLSILSGIPGFSNFL